MDALPQVDHASARPIAKDSGPVADLGHGGC